MVGQELKTITPHMRQVGIFNVRGGGEDLPKQPPAIVSPGSIKRATRARGEENAIPQVEIYVDDQGMAGQEAPSERLVSKAQREARKRLGTRKEVVEAEKEILERKVAKQIKKEVVVEEKTPSGVVKKIVKEKEEIPVGHVVPALMDIDRKEVKARKVEAKAKLAEAEAKKAQAEAFAEMYKNMKYLEYVNKRAKDIQKEKDISWKEAKSDATDEWKAHKGYITEMSISSADEVRGKKGKSESEGHVTDVESKIKTGKPSESDGSFEVKIKPKPKEEEGGGSAPPKKKPTIKRSAERQKELDDAKKAAEEAKKAEEDAKKAEFEARVNAYEAQKQKEREERRAFRKKYGLSQNQILEYVKGLDEEELKKEFKLFEPTRRKYPSIAKMKNAIIKGMGGEVYGGKKGSHTSEESSD